MTGRGRPVAAEPLRLTFRQHVRDRALDAARALTVEKGWSRVRVGDVAALTGVSRPTLYKEFGDKQGLGEALIMQETERFLVGISRTLEAHPQDAAGGITAAIEYVLGEADASPLLCAILTSARDADNELLPMLTTRSAPVLDAATLAREIGIAPGNALRALEPLVRAGVVTEFSGRSRNRLWQAREVLEAVDAFAARAGRRRAG